MSAHDAPAALGCDRPMQPVAGLLVFAGGCFDAHECFRGADVGFPFVVSLTPGLQRAKASGTWGGSWSGHASKVTGLQLDQDGQR